MGRQCDPPDGARDVTASAVHSRKAALVLLALLALVWGVHWAVVKQGLGYMPPLQYAALRLLVGLLTMLAILGAQRRLRRPPRSDVPIILSVGLVQIAAGVLIMNLALQAVPAGRSSVLLYAMPIWVAVLMWVFFRARPRRNELIGLILGLTGLLRPGQPDGDRLGRPCGARRHARADRQRRPVGGRDDPHPAPHLGVEPVGPPAVDAPGRPRARGGGRPCPGAGPRDHWGLPTVLILLYSGALATAFANWASQSITRSLGPLTAAVGYLAIPVVGLIAGAVLLGESLGPIDIAGFALVLGGIAAASLVPPRVPPSASREAIQASG